MARWIWATDNRDALNLNLLARLEIHDNLDGTYNVSAYYATGAGETGRTIARNVTSLANAQSIVETVIGDSVAVATPVGDVIDVDP